MAGKKKKKNNSKSDRVLTGALILCVLLILICIWKIGGILYDYYASNNLYDKLKDTYVAVNTEEDGQQSETEEEPAVSTESDALDGNKDWYHMVDVDVVGLQRENPDVAGYIWFENEDISYPVLYSGDNTTYLRHSMDHHSATAGCIFIEGQNNPDFQDSHTIIYGHNMRNLSMFGKLKYYYQQDGYYDTHQYFQIITATRKYRYHIFAYQIVDPTSDVYTIPYGNNDEFGTFIDQLYRKSMINTGVLANQTDKIITLSTCADDDRFVIHAVLESIY